MSNSLRAGSIIVFTLAVVCAARLHAEETPTPTEKTSRITWHSDAKQAWEAMRKQGRPLLLFITTDGCGYCNRMKTATYGDNKVGSEVGSKFVALKLNADHDLEDAWLERFGIEYFPTTLLITPDLKVVDRIEGYVDAEKMYPRLSKVARDSKGIRTAKTPNPESNPKE